MAFPFVPYTFTDAVANDVTAARLNAIAQAARDAQQAYAVRVFHSAAQSTVSGTGLALAFNSERFDQFAGGAGGMHDTVTNNSRLTAPVGGVYAIFGHIQWASSAGGTFRVLDIRHQGVTQIGRSFVPPINSGGNGQSVSSLYALATNEYVELVATQDSGGALNVLSAANFSPEFGMVRVA